MTSYTLHNQGTYGLVASGDPGPYTVGTAFTVSQDTVLTGIWFYSGASAVSLPSSCVIYTSGGSQVAGTLNSSPSWSGALGSGWVKCSYNGSVILVPGTTYVVSVYDAGTGGQWFYDESAYWTSGAGSSGITNGPLTGLSNSAAVTAGLAGQALYTTTNAFPASTTGGYDFGVDVEVSDASSNISISGVTATDTVTAYFGTVVANVNVTESPAANSVAAYFGNVSMSMPGSNVNTGVSALFGSVQLGLFAPVSANQVLAPFGGTTIGVTPSAANVSVSAPFGSVIVPISITELPAAANVVAHFGSVTTNSIPVNIVWSAKLLPSWKATIITDQ